jgi:ubiquinone/menaquinone biosynthesis C-methylase UbiE
MSNAGLFATVAREYANFRPGYPDELFAWLARSCTGRDAVWDCGCGSGQASIALAGYFEKVHATDISPEQVGAARPHPRVSYKVAPAEASGLPEKSVDLVTVAQSLHWFDVEAFYAEARRVSRPGGVIAVWTYPRPEFVDPRLDAVFLDFYSSVVGPFWPPERRHVESHYRTLAFPFDELPHPPFGLRLDWVLEQVIGYVSSWSATARYRKQKGTDPVPLLREALRPLWPGDGTAALRMPLVLKAGRLVR